MLLPRFVVEEGSVLQRYCYSNVAQQMSSWSSRFGRRRLVILIITTIDVLESFTVGGTSYRDQWRVFHEEVRQVDVQHLRVRRLVTPEDEADDGVLV